MILYERFTGIPIRSGSIPEAKVNALKTEAPVFVIWLEPGLPAIPMTDEDCWMSLGDNSNYDMIMPLPGLPLVMSFDDRKLINIEGKRYLLGAAIIYAVDECGFLKSITVQDICDVNQLMELHTILDVRQSHKKYALYLGEFEVSA